MRERLASVLEFVSRPVVAIGGALLIAAIIIGATWYLTSVSASGAYTLATMAPITEEVDVTGAVKPAESTDLSFQTGGQVAAIDVKVGDQVAAGQTLIALNSASQGAALAGAEANLEAAQANLASLQSGTRPQELAIAETAVTQDQDALRNAIQTSYVDSDTAIHTEADQLFSNPRGSNPKLNFVVPDQTLQNQIQADRATLEPVLTAWGAQVNAPTFTSSDPTSAANTAEQNLTTVNQFLGELAEALDETPASASFPATTLSAYQNTIASARGTISGAATALTGAQTALATAEGTLTLDQAGATADSIAAAQAQVDAAQAQVSSVNVELGQSVLVAPIAGTITVQSANPGETVTPGVPLVSLQGSGAFEATAQVSDTQIGEVELGQQVLVTFDAYPNAAPLTAAVTQIDPAATVAQDGTTSYTVTVTFTGNDAELKSGLAANLQIITNQVPSALVVPSSSIITDNGATFVYIKNGSKAPAKTAVTIGIQGANDMTQITSGLSEGDQVLTFGNAQ